MDLTVGAHRGAAALDRLAPEWEALLQRIPGASAFATPGWARAWWRTYGRHHQAVILDVRDGDRLVALLPLQVSHVRGLGVRVLEMLGGSPADWTIWVRNPHGLGFKYVNELLVSPGSEAGVLRALRSFLDSGALRWDTLRFTCVPADSALAQGFNEFARGWSPRATPFARLRVDTSRPFEEYRATLSKRQRQDTRYKPNELTRAVGAPLRLDVVRGAAAAGAVEEFVEMFERRWTARGKPGLLSGEADMYRNLVRDEPSLVVLRLLGGERALAAQIGFDDGCRYTPYNYAFDPEFSAKSPSHVLTQMIIEQCCADGHECIEQLSVAMGRHWSKQETVTHTLEATRPAAPSKLRAGALRGAGNAIRRAQTTTAGHRARAALARAAAAARRRSPPSA
ncbi:MAG TPA: GNAT family N-acetyltransferase [Candidatus Angelobacter sp.]|jgi:CelD/BcsL family acetyltransferase involved in cellulose biosynthesis|nr:GNAT family N-acetyltransferase [Candidatus Angelobacter sp.]